jgi:hypothetical protein
MLLVPIPWAGRVWALPFLTALAPSERYCRERGLRHKMLTAWGRQLILQARGWMPDRPLVLVTDSGFSALECLAALLRQEIICVTRLRLDAALYQPAPPRPQTSCFSSLQRWEPDPILLWRSVVAASPDA